MCFAKPPTGRFMGSEHISYENIYLVEGKEINHYTNHYSLTLPNTTISDKYERQDCDET